LKGKEKKLFTCMSCDH